MPDPMLTNPAAAFAPPASYLTYTDKDGNDIEYGRQVRPMRANDTISRYSVVGLVGATATVPASVEILDVSDAIANFVCVGVALEAGVAGDIISICTFGLTLVRIDDTGTVALGDIVTKHASTDGAVALIANGTWTADATAAAGPGKALGFFVGPEVGTSNLAPMWFTKF